MLDIRIFHFNHQTPQDTSQNTPTVNTDFVKALRTCPRGFLVAHCFAWYSPPKDIWDTSSCEQWKKTCCSGYIGNEKLPSYHEIKIPSLNNQYFMETKKAFFGSSVCWNLPPVFSGFARLWMSCFGWFVQHTLDGAGKTMMGFHPPVFLWWCLEVTIHHKPCHMTSWLQREGTKPTNWIHAFLWGQWFWAISNRPTSSTLEISLWYHQNPSWFGKNGSFL